MNAHIFEKIEVEEEEENEPESFQSNQLKNEDS
jgi:hypothetical protein